MTVVKASAVFDQVDEKEVTEFLNDFNKKMSNPEYVKDWRCGGEGRGWWQFARLTNHNVQTKEKLCAALKEAGWVPVEIVHGFDRTDYTTYRIAREETGLANYVIQTDISADLKAMVDAMSAEFVEHKGHITCEFSVQEKYLVALHNYTFDKNKEIQIGEWHIYRCETCVERHIKHPFHAIIKSIN